ncbi:MAG: hypothetical protein B7Z80_00660 [Rhodospirillales bacterium 20-64-7]|nr:MAG: hypothetical protein B7Z80_00660 [Rhodospirillales bacterium 20-64-7]
MKTSFGATNSHDTWATSAGRRSRVGDIRAHDLEEENMDTFWIWIWILCAPAFFLVVGDLLLGRK